MLPLGAGRPHARGGRLPRPAGVGDLSRTRQAPRCVRSQRRPTPPGTPRPDESQGRNAASDRHAHACHGPCAGEPRARDAVGRPLASRAGPGPHPPSGATAAGHPVGRRGSRHALARSGAARGYRVMTGGQRTGTAPRRVPAPPPRAPPRGVERRWSPIARAGPTWRALPTAIYAATARAGARGRGDTSSGSRRCTGRGGAPAPAARRSDRALGIASAGAGAPAGVPRRGGASTGRTSDSAPG